MGPETLHAMSGEMYLNLMMMAQTVVLIIGLAAIAGFAIYLISIAWLCFLETRQPARRQMHWMHSAPEPPEPDDYDLLVALPCLDDRVAGEAMRREQTVMRHA